MRFRVDPWSVEYGASVESELTPERGRGQPRRRAARRTSWEPVGRRGPTRREPATVLFVDGVRRVDARVWIEDPDGDAAARDLRVVRRGRRALRCRAARPR